MTKITEAQVEAANSNNPQYTDEALAAVAIDFLDAKADAWMAETGQSMLNAIASVFEKHASQELMDRFREQMGAIGHMCFVEGALRAWSEISAERAAAPPPPPDGAVEAAVLGEREAMRGAARDERRECANLAELTGVPYGPWQEPSAPDTFNSGAAYARRYIAAAIRARSAAPQTKGGGE